MKSASGFPNCPVRSRHLSRDVMPVHISTPTERLRKDRRIVARRHELIGLLIGSLLIGWFVWREVKARTADFGLVAQQLKSGEVVNLNALASPDQLVRYLDFLPSDAERRFVAERMYRHIAAAHARGE